MDDAQIIELFFARSEDAIAAVSDRYGGYCHAVAIRIVPTPEDAEECVSETWLRAWNAIPPQRPQVLRLFLGRITRNVSLNRLAAETAAKRGGAAKLPAASALEELEEVVGTDAVEEAADAAELERCIAAFLAAQKPQNRKVFLRRYYYFDTTAEIARRCGLREANVLVILSRTRAALRTYLEKEGYTL